MDQGAMDTAASRADLRAHAAAFPHAPAAPPPPPPPPVRTQEDARRRMWSDLTILGVVGMLLVAAIGTGVVSLYRQLYSPTAFVSSYLHLLADGHAADALAVPGVNLDSTVVEREGMTPDASEALLRSAALSSLTDIEPVSEETRDGVTAVTFTYRAGGFVGSTTFSVQQDGWLGVVPAWRFAESPLAVIDLSVLGSMRFAVNDFPLDIRQVSPKGDEAIAGDAAPLLVLSPGLYSVAVDSPIAQADPVHVLADKPLASIPVQIKTSATEKFVEAVQQEVDGFLDACATQEVLQPTGCPFGFLVSNRIDSLPQWSIAQYPEVEIYPAGALWTVPTVTGVAHIDVDIRSLFDGSVRTVSEDVPFEIGASIEVLPDNTVSIKINGAGDGEQ